MSYRTEKRMRGDIIDWALAQKKLAPVNGFIGQRFFPLSMTHTDSNKIRHIGLVAVGSAQVNRNAVTTALTKNAVATTEKTYSCEKYEKRHVMTEDEAKECGSIENADKIGGTASLLTVKTAHEAAAAAEVFDATAIASPVTLEVGKLVKGINAAGLVVKRYYGSYVLGCSQSWFLQFIQETEIASKIMATFGAAGVTDLFSRFNSTPAAVASIISPVIGFSEILVGDDDQWKLTGHEDLAVVAKLPRADEVNGESEMRMLYKLHPIYGVCKWFLPDPANDQVMFELESHWDDDMKLNTYDALGKFDLLKLNAGAAQVVKLAAMTTTTTTAAE
jgi:hypothetical protein